MVWQALDASCNCLERNHSSPCQCDSGVYVDVAESNSSARYIDHSQTPNMAIQHQAFKGVELQTWPALVTTHAIPGYTELELDYGCDFVLPPRSFESPHSERRRGRFLQKGGFSPATTLFTPLLNSR